MKKLILFPLMILFSCDPPGDTRLMFKNDSSFFVIFTRGDYRGDSIDSFQFYECSSSKLGHTYLESGEGDVYPTSPGGNWESVISSKPNGTAVFFSLSGWFSN